MAKNAIEEALKDSVCHGCDNWKYWDFYTCNGKILKLPVKHCMIKKMNGVVVTYGKNEA